MKNKIKIYDLIKLTEYYVCNLYWSLYSAKFRETWMKEAFDYFTDKNFSAQFFISPEEVKIDCFFQNYSIYFTINLYQKFVKVDIFSGKSDSVQIYIRMGRW